MARPGRPRWPAGGQQDGWNWEAFVADPGCLLEALVEHRRLPWYDALKVLEQLTGELVDAEADGSLPATLSLEQVGRSIVDLAAGTGPVGGACRLSAAGLSPLP